MKTALFVFFILSMAGCAHTEKQVTPKSPADEKLEQGVQILQDVDATDKGAALVAFVEACNLGNNNACHKVGTAYSKGLYSVSRDYTKARQWYLKAAMRGYAPSQQNIANLYAYRLLDESNDVEGYKWLLLAEKTVATCLPGTIEAQSNTLAAERRRLCQLASAGQGRLRSIFRKRMSSEQMQQSERLARQWSAKHSYQE